MSDPILVEISGGDPITVEVASAGTPGPAGPAGNTNFFVQEADPEPGLPAHFGNFVWFSVDSSGVPLDIRVGKVT